MQEERSARVGFANNPLDRLSEKRDDEVFIAALRADRRARFIMIAGDRPLVRRSGDDIEALFGLDAPGALGQPHEEVLLGTRQDGAAIFAMALSGDGGESLAPDGIIAPADLRALANEGRLPASLLALIGEAKAVCDWHRRHRFCAACGAPTAAVAAGWRRQCPACGAQHFPRVDPVVIMLAIAGEFCLLGRQPRFPAGMYSALAGFVEPGETIEEAVRREIREEAGIACGAVRYLASQPWPFPSSLMIGCLVEAASTAITIDATEIEDARWFSRDEARQLIDRCHPDGLTAPLYLAIAHHLIRAFVDGETVTRQRP